jgi:hypothetical protein
MVSSKKKKGEGKFIKRTALANGRKAKVHSRGERQTTKMFSAL